MSHGWRCVTSHVVSVGGTLKPPGMPAATRGMNTDSTNASQLSFVSWTATTCQPPFAGPAAWKI